MIALRRPTVFPDWLRDFAWPRLAPMRVLPLLTVVLLLTSAPEQWYLRGPLVALFALGVAFRSWLASPYYWYAVATLLGTTVYLNWANSDNHKYLFVYWTLALCAALTLPKAQQAPALARASRWLIGLCMLLATIWKVISPDYLNGSFFEYTLLCDERFAGLAHQAAGLPLAELAANRELKGVVLEGQFRGQSLTEATLVTSPAVARVAQAMTWWTIGIEGLLAVLFLWPDNRRIAPLRNGALLIFAATTYVVAPVRGFGWILMLLGMAQCKDDEHRTRLAYLAMLVVIQFYTLPVGDVLKLLAG
jgi:hypothetical protein